MKYLQKYDQYQESWRSKLATAGLMGSLLLTGPETGAADIKNGTELGEKTEQKKMEENILSISNKRKDICTDNELNIILDEIKSNINSKDSTKFLELFNRLDNHLSTKYNYQITPTEIPTEVNMTTDTFSLVAIMGWLGSMLLAVCGAPQAWQSFKDKHSDGISWAFLLLWGFGEIFCLGYVYNKLDLPLFVNYAINIVIVGVMVYYKINPDKNKTEENDQEV